MFTKEPSGLILHAYKSLSTGHLWDNRYIQTIQDVWSSERAPCNARGFTVSSCMHYSNHTDNCYVWDEFLFEALMLISHFHAISVSHMLKLQSEH